jgi:hypothetical protein
MGKLESYNFPRSTVDSVAPIVSTLKAEGVVAARRVFADSIFNWCERIELNEATPEEIDKCFTLLDLYLGEQGGEAQLGDDAEKLLVEGMTLHHLGDDSGTSLEALRRLAEDLLQT